MKSFLSKYFQANEFFIVCFFILPFLPDFETLDKIGPQFLYLSSLSLVISIYLLFFKRKNETKVNHVIISNFAFILISIISFFSSEFLLQSWIELIRLLTYFISLYFLYIISTKSTNLIFNLLLLLFLAETIAVFSNFISVFDYENPLGRTRLLQGLSSNLNVGAFSILIKIPLVLTYLSNQKKFLIITLSYVLLSIAVFDIFIMSSRGAILGLTIYFLGLFSYYAVKRIFKLSKTNQAQTSIIIFSLSLITAFFSHTLLFKNQQTFKVLNRMNSFEGDSSTSDRLEYLDYSINMFKESPILGKGIGTWKVNSIDQIGEKLIEYQVPYHAHNDILQLLAETGVLGALLYLLIFTIPLFFLFKTFFNTKKNKFQILNLIFCLFIFLLDSLINFPKARPFSMINIIMILVLIGNIYLPTMHLNIKKISLKKIAFISTLILIPITFWNFKLFQSLQHQIIFYLDYNVNKDLSRPISEFANVSYRYENLSPSVMPVANQLANYYIEQGKQDEAIILAREGKKANPFLYVAENQIGQAYFFKNNLDSSYYYSKLAFEKRPINIAHVTQLQRVMFAKDEPFHKFDSLYQRVKNMPTIIKDPAFWINHFQAIIDSRKNGNYTEKDKELASKAVQIFPDNKSIKAFEKIIKFGINTIGLSSNLDNQASILFQEEKFEDAIELWKQSIELLPTEDAYYLNIAQALIAMEQADKAIDYLRTIERLKIKENDGKFEFLLGLYFLNKGKSMKACQSLKSAVILNNKEAYDAFLLLGCKN